MVTFNIYQIMPFNLRILALTCCLIVSPSIQSQDINEKGETTLRIPVTNKQAVKNLLSLVGKLFG